MIPNQAAHFHSMSAGRDQQEVNGTHNVKGHFSHCITAECFHDQSSLEEMKVQEKGRRTEKGQVVGKKSAC